MEDVYLYVVRRLKVPFGGDTVIEECSVFLSSSRSTHKIRLLHIIVFFFLRGLRDHLERRPIIRTHLILLLRP